ncbi:MAG TPA: hypothetical protein VK509_09715 [Polyangiales bacterium]|nr:hypothetical protein [Polyangiales bacterium]
MRWLCSSLLALLSLLAAGCHPRASQPAADSTSGGEYPPVAQAQVTPAPAADLIAPPAGPAASEAELEPEPVALQLPPYAAIIIHDVKDYEAWRAGFDANADARKGASLIGEAVMRGVDEDRTVAVYMPATDMAKVRAFFAAPELAKKMKEGGVQGKPTVYLFKLAAAKMAMQPEGNVYSAIVKYHVNDFDAFKRAIEAGDAARNAAGLIGWGVGQGADKATDAYLYLQSSDPAKLKAYLGAKKTKSALKRAGARGQAQTTLVQEISNRMYE